ncbi:hypothetical protein [Nocardia colli]|uniref:hypothetical protein n=1 Tax=Nocardia colli TaxID=2545717 RepID=UPI0035DD96AD
MTRSSLITAPSRIRYSLAAGSLAAVALCTAAFSPAAAPATPIVDIALPCPSKDGLTACIEVSGNHVHAWGYGQRPGAVMWIGIYPRPRYDDPPQKAVVGPFHATTIEADLGPGTYEAIFNYDDGSGQVMTPYVIVNQDGCRSGRFC